MKYAHVHAETDGKIVGSKAKEDAVAMHVEKLN